MPKLGTAIATFLQETILSISLLQYNNTLIFLRYI